MARRGENIRRRKDGRWEGRYPKGKKNGKPITGSVFGRTYQETKEKLIVAKAELTEFSNTSIENHVFKEETFRSAAEDWLVFIEPTLKESSISRYRTVLEKHLLPEFGDIKVSNISRNDVANFSARLLSCGSKNGTSLAPKTVSSIQSVMKNVMDYVRHVKCIPVIDFNGLTVKQSTHTLRVFSLCEQKNLNNYLLKDITLTKLGILLCLYTGIRIGELCALKWKDISFTEQKLCIKRTMQRIQKPDGNGHKTQVIITTPKSDSSIRDIPLPDGIIHILNEMKQPNDSFFLTGLEKVYVEPRTMENRFNRVIEACGIKNATMHTCRHTFATRAVELGFDIKTLSEILGHANVSITMNRYVHPSMALKKENMDKFSSILGVNNGCV